MQVLCSGELWIPKGYGPILSNWPGNGLVYYRVFVPSLLHSYCPLFVYWLPGQCLWFQKTGSMQVYVGDLFDDFLVFYGHHIKHYDATQSLQ